MTKIFLPAGVNISGLPVPARAKKKVKIDIVITDGDVKRRLVWIERTSSGFQWSVHVKGFDKHVTYHEDGNYHTYEKGCYIESKMKQPLGEFRGFEVLFTAFVNRGLLKKGRMKVFHDNKADWIVYVDERVFVKDKICIFAGLLEPYRLDKYPYLDTNLSRGEFIQLITCTHPWVLISVFDVQGELTHYA